MNLKDKTVVITGATGGIGRELSKRIASEGAKLILVSRTKSELNNLIKSLNGKEHDFYTCNFDDPKDVDKAAKLIGRKFGKIDVFVSAAGVGIYKPIEELNLDDFTKSLNVNLVSNFIFIKELQKNLENSENPLVLAIGSGMGVIPAAGRSAYCASKFALRGFILSLNSEFNRTKLKFCLITLGSTLTSFGPMSLDEKQADALSGKAYFTPEWVGKKLTQIIMDDVREIEYTLYPGDYGFGSWSPPASSKG